MPGAMILCTGSGKLALVVTKREGKEENGLPRSASRDDPDQLPEALMEGACALVFIGPKAR